jgi:hypothetical protein
MPENLILKSQAKQVFDALKSNGLEPSEFALTKADSFGLPGLDVNRLVHNNTNYYFQFDFNKNNQHICSFSPGQQTNIEIQLPGNWELLWPYFLGWIAYLQREIATPDIWATLSGETKLSEIANSNLPNDSFSVDEQKLIQTSLQEIKIFLISNQSFDQDKLALIDARLNYLQAASERLGKKDWIIIAIGSLISLVIGLALAPDISRELFRLSSQTLSWLLQGHPLLP